VPRGLIQWQELPLAQVAQQVTIRLPPLKQVVEAVLLDIIPHQVAQLQRARSPAQLAPIQRVDLPRAQIVLWATIQAHLLSQAARVVLLDTFREISLSQVAHIVHLGFIPP